MRYKFRAWDKVDKVMIYPDQVDRGDRTWPVLLAVGFHGLPIAIDRDCFKQHEITAWNRDHNLELMLWTGLTDKNGTEVYEGDILFDEPDEFFSETRNLFIVEWLENKCGFAFHRNKTRIYENSSDLISDNAGTVLLEVIGNIHDNPELLESGGKP